MKKRWLCLLLVLATLIAYAASGEQSAPAAILGSGSFFPLESPVTLTAWVVNAVDSVSVSDNYVLDWIEEKANVRLEITREFSGSDAKRQLNLCVETEAELPDILLCTRWSKAECALYGIEGVVLPLDEYLKGCENWNRLNDICGPGRREDLTMPDGHIYCFGSVNECFHLTHQARMWVYQPWIDALCGGKLPETTEEFRDYLRKVLESDPNGNGLKDEIPLTGQIAEGWATDPITFLSNSFVHNNTIFGSTNQTVAPGCYVDDGQVKCTWAEEGYREALRYLRDLCREGLLHSQAFTQNGRQLSARLEAEPHLVGAVASGYFPKVEDHVLDNGTYSEWVCLPPLAGPDGTRMSYQSGYDYFYNCNGLLTRDCRYPDIAIQLFDLLASSEGTLVQNFGQEGIDWVWCEADDGMGIDDSPAIYRFLWENQGIPRDKQQYWPADVQICSNFDSFRKGALVGEGTFNGENELWKCAELYEQYSPGKDSVYPNIVSSEEASKKLVNYQSAIGQYVRQSTIYFITDYMNLDSDWNAYLSMLDVLGMRDYQSLLQQAYDEYITN
ncbi:MAG: hypothetical protein IKH30_00775 [Clostridia bacterium]|nr:hypothetical protein [Clostridia bacterium]